MYGEKRELITFQCRTCNAACPVWVDREDLERVKLGVLVRNAFANRGGESYLTAAERELFISGTCDSCWQTLRPAVAHASCKRCGKSVGAPSLCEECFEIAQLCGLVRDFAAAVPHFTGMNAKAKLLDDFARVVIVFGVADGSLSPSELAILGDLLCYLEPEDVTGANAMQISFGYADCILKENPKPVPEAPCSMTALDSHDRATGTHYGDVFRSLLFRLANLVARADGVVTATETEFLKYYEMILRYGWVQQSTTPPMTQPAIRGNTAPESPRASAMSHAQVAASPREAVSPRSLDSLLVELNSLIGLRQVKAEVAKLASFLQVEQLRKSRGLKQSEISLHMEFYGNPGTGKTTIARLIGQIYQALGFLSRGHLVEADRSKLVGGYLGQTAIKTDEVIGQAVGGVLFIDEAYSLAAKDSSQDSYGQEAIEVILKNMEDHREDLVVIVAGYPVEMADFLASNPGLKSRFNRFINFEDYSPDELFQIYGRFASNAQYKIGTAAADKLNLVFDAAYKNRDRQFGNGRFVRNLFERSIQQLASRIVGLPRVTDETLTTVEAADIPDAELVSPTPRKMAPIGFEIPK